MNRLRLLVAVLNAGLLLAWLPAAHAAQGYDQPHVGKATHYVVTGLGNCSVQTSDIPTAAMNQIEYNNSEACGACIEVTNQNNNKSVVVKIDNRCPECGVGHLDLTETAFSRVAALKDGIIPIKWRYISCAYSTVKLYFKEGSNPWWTAVQARDHRYPILSIAYKAAGSSGAYIKLPRFTYNYFIAEKGMGPGPYDFQITDIYGAVVYAKNIPLKLTTPMAINQQFPVNPAAPAGLTVK